MTIIKRNLKNMDGTESSNPRQSSRKLVWREVQMSRPYEPQAVHDILTHIGALTSRGPIVWEVRARDNHVRYLLATIPKSVSRLEEVWQSHVDTQFAPVEERTPVTMARKIRITRSVLPLNTEVAAATVRAVLAAMTGGRKDTETVVQVMLGAAYAPGSVPRNMPDPDATWLDAVLGTVHNATSEQRKAAKFKEEQFRYDAMIRVGASGERAESRVYNIISALRTLESAGVRIHAEEEFPLSLNRAAMPWVMPLRLSVKEIACFLLLPAGEEELPGTPGLHPKLMLLPGWYREPNKEDTNKLRPFGRSLGSNPKTLSIAPHDALEHTVIMGPTGAGKSTAMLHLILADINAGRSVLVIDPKADLVTGILERIPESRRDDVVVLDLTDPCPVGFNPLAYSQDPTLTADAILAVFEEVFRGNWGIRSADVLGGALLTLARIKGANLLWLPLLLTDKNFRQKVVAQVDDPIALNPFWRHFEEMRDSERRTEIAPVLNKLRQITYRPGLRNVLGQSEPKFSLNDLFYKRRIMLVPLNRGLIGTESARLIGSLVVSLTWTLALSRVKIPPEKRHLISIYIDELQDYLSLPTSFSDALAQARGLGVAYTVAHQYRGQLPQDIKAGIDANCRNKIIFGLGSDDARDMAAQAPELQPMDFMTLPRYEIYTTFQSKGRSTGWVSGRTEPEPPAIRLAAEIKAESMQRYGTPTEETERALTALMSGQTPTQATPTKATKATPNPNQTEVPIGRRRKS